ncbi:hypothetical protein LOTGIDRAFT_233236 [Lottia gigantea]|uniref:Sushi, von Willebrand factor type A, EGF and pentraxin domain-containing protein 1 n=1 Tax=Lottia gigantea TaxID=225164 RepID=V4AAV6_LOTGI|nr:hypothetical protein LOTGIDRAFT_233236 [Lottia gigantea]ESO92235.1 hypothetical protein LOTGIDRAFT_233236 [Lottia gigantea]
MRLHCLVAVLVVLVLIDVGEGFYRRYYRYQGGRRYYRYQAGGRYYRYQAGGRYYRYQAGSRYNLPEITNGSCMKWSIVKYIVTHFTCPNPDPCVMIDCNCNGKCVDGICQCYTGFHGHFCSEPIPECQNGGNLVAEDGKLKCNCLPGTSGEDCTIDCGAVPPGNFSTGTAASGTTFPNEADYTCNEGYEVASGDFSIKCLASGQWDVANILVCQAKDCGPPPEGTLSTGTVNGDSTFPNNATYTCDEGNERLSGKTVISCLASGRWETDILVCQPSKKCESLPIDVVFVVDGSSSVTSDNFTTMINAIADSGFVVFPRTAYVGLVVFSGNFQPDEDIIPLSPSDPNTLATKIRALVNRGGLGDASFGVSTAQDTAFNNRRPDTMDLIILLTTGNSTNPQSDANMIFNIDISAYGIGPDVGLADLEKFVNSDIAAVFLDTFDEIQGVFDPIAASLC